jgi:hypothetical protein
MTDGETDKRSWARSAVYIGLAVNMAALAALFIARPNGGSLTVQYHAHLKIAFCMSLVLLTCMAVNYSATPYGFDKSQRVQRIGTIILSGFIAAVAFHYLMGSFGCTYPKNTFLFSPDDRFMDLFNILRGCQDRDPYNPDRIGYIGGYFPLAYFVGYLLSLIRPWVISFALYSLAFVAFFWVCNAKHLKLGGDRAGSDFPNALIFTFLTYPFAFVIDRANFDMLMFSLLVLFMICYRRRNYWPAGALLAVTIAMKVYTGVFLALFLADKRYKEAIFTGLLVVALTAASLAALNGGLVANWHKWMVEVPKAYDIGVAHGSIIRFSSSLYTMIVTSGALLADVHLNANAVFNTAYSLAAAGLFAAATVYLWFVKRPPWKKVCLLTILMILLPYSSGDYRLLFLFVPIWLYVNDQTRSRYDPWYCLLFGALLIPKNYDTLVSDLNICMLINPPLLAALLFVLLLPDAPVAALAKPLSRPARRAQ